MAGNKGMRWALETKDAYRIGTNLPNLTDETVFIEPEQALELLKKNRWNRQMNYRAAHGRPSMQFADQAALISLAVFS